MEGVSDVMDERVRFISRLLDGEQMARLCAEFGISRKTGYKIYRRYKGCGVEGLTDRSRRRDRRDRVTAPCGRPRKDGVGCHVSAPLEACKGPLSRESCRFLQRRFRP